MEPATQLRVGRVHTWASVLAAPGVALCGVPCEQFPLWSCASWRQGQPFHAWAAGGSHSELNHIFTRRKSVPVACSENHP